MVQLNPRQAGHIEGYAAALQDIMQRLTGECWCDKECDPAEVVDGRLYSYAYDLRAGGRVHELSEFGAVEDVTGLMLAEVAQHLRDELTEFGATLPKEKTNAA